ncbi:MAG: endonuclease/exonuclease/phosphatase family protein [Bacteroidetes bacterium]|nr:endonuclease/exonuclease/phosphatase family protein [Bacteroidota bacterium]
MAGFFGNIIKYSLIAINVICGIAMLSLYALPYTNQKYFGWFNLLAIVFPILLLLQILFFLLWFILKPRLVFIPLILCVLSYKLMLSFFAVGNATSASNEKNNFRIFSWNVHMFNFYEHKGKHSQAMIQKVRNQDADVFCAQEVVYDPNPNAITSLDNLKKRLGYPYAITADDTIFGAFTNHKKSKRQFNPFCLIIFSKYPIVQWKKVQTRPNYYFTFMWADILKGKDTVRVFNTHFQSLHFVKKDYQFLENIDQQESQEVSQQSKNILRRMKQAGQLRAQQVTELEKVIRQSPHPVILCGDFNDVPNSYSYQRIRRQLNDVFLEKGNGIGRTFRMLAPTLRIDYIFHDQSLIPQTFKVHEWELGDHYALEASFSLPSAP